MGGGSRGDLLFPELVQGYGYALDVLPDAGQQPVTIEREQDRVREAADAGHIAITGAGGGEDQQVARRRPAGEQELAGRVCDRLLCHPRRQEHDDVAAGAAEPQCVARGEVHRLHPPGQGAKRAVRELRENRRHFEDAHTKLQDGRLVRLELAARSH